MYYGNRSIAYLRTECFGYALTDASKAIELDRNYVKGYYRRAAAYMSLGKFKLALTDYRTVVRARPNDKDALTRCTECSKMVKVLAFQKAISVEEKKNIADMINLEAMGKYFIMSSIKIKASLIKRKRFFDISNSTSIVNAYNIYINLFFSCLIFSLQ